VVYGLSLVLWPPLRAAVAGAPREPDETG